jgi:hypothetical protein
MPSLTTWIGRNAQLSSGFRQPASISSALSASTPAADGADHLAVCNPA